jgi:hypothetical protein
MRDYLLFVTLGLAVWGATNIMASLAVWAWWRRVRNNIERKPPAARTRVLFAARVAPAFSATFITGAVVLPSFYRFEPRGTGEVAGWMLSLMASLALALVATALISAARVLVMTRRLQQACERTATPIVLEGSTVPTLRVECDFPIVAVVGAVRPRLLIARQVLDTCDRDEIASIVAHEEYHISSFDNLRHLVIDCCPDVLRFTRVGRELGSEWHRGAEELADDRAASTRPGASEHLASALVRVARLASNCTPNFYPASALFSGGNIERRVRRLLRDEPNAQTYRLSIVKQLAIVSSPAAVWSTPASRAIYEVLELAVKSLP